MPRRSLRSRVICRRGKRCETDDDREGRRWELLLLKAEIADFLRRMETYDRAFGKGWTVTDL